MTPAMMTEEQLACRCVSVEGKEDDRTVENVVSEAQDSPASPARTQKSGDSESSEMDDETIQNLQGPSVDLEMESTEDEEMACTEEDLPSQPKKTLILPAKVQQRGNRDAADIVEERPKETPGTSDTISSPCPHYLMTTRELQLYWKAEKSKRKPVRLVFDIQSTRIAEDFLSKFVLYKIVIIKTGSYDGSKVFIERRYSDFEKLHKNLLKDFKEEMEDIMFPKKVLMGNMIPEIINKRILMLNDYLRELYAIKYIRKSKKFMDFFINPELEEGYSCLRGGQYDKALEIFQNIVYLQEKIASHFPTVMIPSLCALLVCYKDLDEIEKAYEVGTKVVPLIEKHPGHKYYVPLLDTMISLAYKLEKDFVSLQKQLSKGENMMRRGLEITMFTLKEMVVQECTS
ncbi:sorting nexin-20 isoform X2 [Bombina bombina]|uniref:sorting nexin-20 isoform X2 n=1 Tax=Bombina bombina TaxID=8345 RepID=UPI00235ACFD5|nr:sorting nexin-20 isoform X2 [Bombina bombina]